MTLSDTRAALLAIVANNPSYIHGGGRLDPGDWAYQYTFVPGAHAADGVQSPTTLNNNSSDVLTVDDYLARRFPTAASLPAPTPVPVVTVNPLLPAVPATPPVNALLYQPPTAAVAAAPFSLFGLSGTTLLLVVGGALLLLMHGGGAKGRA